VVVFFVTSSDSGSLVVDSLASGGKLESPVPQRVFWAVLEGVVAATLLLGGGLSALQTAAISAGLPFAVVLLVMCFSIYKGLSYEHDVIHVKKALQQSEAAEAWSFASPWGRTVSKRNLCFDCAFGYP
jgi:choline/glycine/proline betaine transport protein